MGGYVSSGDINDSIGFIETDEEFKIKIKDEQAFDFSGTNSYPISKSEMEQLVTEWLLWLPEEERARVVKHFMSLEAIEHLGIYDADEFEEKYEQIKKILYPTDVL